MRRVRRFAAFASGVLLYGTAILASTLVDKDLLLAPIRSFIAGRYLATLAAAAITALFIFLLAFVWGFITLRPRQGDRRLLTSWCMGGIVLAWMSSMVAGLFVLALQRADHRPDLIGLLLSSGVPPLWGLLNVIAVFAGAILASMTVRSGLTAVSLTRRPA
ncbi:MAG: hypothetical protein JO224_01665 [Pelomonas sp.]|nr:hypothetical protein [Roseateles sp.]